MKNDEKNFEIIEDIPEYDLKIIQNKNYFKFGLDSVALAKFAANNKTKPVIVDACSGSGAVGLIYSRLVEQKSIYKSGFVGIDKMFYIEKQEYFADLNTRNLKLNNIKNAKVINKDINNTSILDEIEQNSVDIILINPPYNIPERSVTSALLEKNIAKFEDSDFLNNFFSFASKILKSRGEIFMVHRPERLVDIFTVSRKYMIEPKILKMVSSSNHKKPSIVLLKFVKNARPFLKIEDPYIANVEGTELKSL